MRTFKDTRGRSWFDIVPEMDWQVDITHSYPGTIRAFHHHEKKIEWMFVVKGNFKFVVTDPYFSPDTTYLSEGEMIKIEPGYWHGYQNIGTGEGIMMEVADHKHDVNNPDDQRKPYDEFDEWEKEKK